MKINVSRLVKTVVKTVSKNKSTILTVAGLCGLGATVYATAKVAPKAAKKIDEAKHEKFMASAKEKGLTVYSDDELDDVAYTEMEAGKAVKDSDYVNEKLSIIERIKVAWKYYLVIIGVAGATALAIIFAHHIDSKTIAGLSVAYAASEKKGNEWMQEAKKKLGVEEFKEAKEEIANKEAARVKIAETDLNEGECWVFDTNTNRYFKSSLLKVEKGFVEALGILNHEEGRLDWRTLCELIGEDEVHANADESIFTYDRNKGLPYSLEPIPGTDNRYTLEYDMPVHYKELGLSSPY